MAQAIVRTTPGCGWICHDCGFTTDDFDTALEHPLRRGNFTHWLYEHPLASRLRPPLREIHTSDAGGCYVSPVHPEKAKALTREYREQHGRGAF